MKIFSTVLSLFLVVSGLAVGRNSLCSIAQDLVPILPPTQDDGVGRPTLPSEPSGVAVEEIQATRSSVDSLSRLDVKLRVPSGGGNRVSGFRCRVHKAVDDTGVDLIPVRSEVQRFTTLGRTVHLNLPVRNALVLKEFSGVVEVLLLDRDPEASINVTGFVGKASCEIQHPSLAGSRVKLTTMSKSEFNRVCGPQPTTGQRYSIGNDLQRTVVDVVRPGVDRRNLDDNSLFVLQNDPEQRIVSIEFLDRGGNRVPTILNETGVVLHKGEMLGYCVYNFDGKLDGSAVMRIGVATPKAVVVVPFFLRGIPLP